VSFSLLFLFWLRGSSSQHFVVVFDGSTLQLRPCETVCIITVPAKWCRDGTFKHTMEGDDDMPGHVKSSLMGPSLNIPVRFDILFFVFGNLGCHFLNSTYVFTLR